MLTITLSFGVILMIDRNMLWQAIEWQRLNSATSHLQCNESFMCTQITILKTQSQENVWDQNGKSVSVILEGKNRTCARVSVVIKCQNSSYLWLAEAFEVFSIWYRKTREVNEQARHSSYMDQTCQN